ITSTEKFSSFNRLDISSAVIPPSGNGPAAAIGAPSSTASMVIARTARMKSPPLQFPRRNMSRVQHTLLADGRLVASCLCRAQLSQASTGSCATRRKRRDRSESTPLDTTAAGQEALEPRFWDLSGLAKPLALPRGLEPLFSP